MKIVEDAVKYIRDTIADLKKLKGRIDWKFYTTGHSMGGFLATAVAVELDPEITRCVNSFLEKQALYTSQDPCRHNACVQKRQAWC